MTKSLHRHYKSQENDLSIETLSSETILKILFSLISVHFTQKAKF